MKLIDLQKDLLCSIREAESFHEIDLSICETMNILIENNLFNWQILVFLENLELQLRRHKERRRTEKKEYDNISYAFEHITLLRKVVQLKTFSLS